MREFLLNLVLKRREFMKSNFTDGFLALVALVFVIFEFSYSKIIIIVAIALILLHSILHMGNWCECGSKKQPVKSKSKK